MDLYKCIAQKQARFCTKPARSCPALACAGFCKHIVCVCWSIEAVVQDSASTLCVLCWSIKAVVQNSASTFMCAVLD